MAGMTLSELAKMTPSHQKTAIAVSGIPGAYLIIYPTGRRSWAWRGILRADGYRFRPSTIWVTLGLPPKDDSASVKRWLQSEVARVADLTSKGIDPRKEAQKVAEPTPEAPKVITVDDAFEAFQAEHLTMRSTAYQDDNRNRYRLHVQPHIGSTPIAGLTRGAVDGVLGVLAKAGKDTTANRVRSLVSKLWNFSERRYDLVGVNPVKGSTKREEAPREVVLSLEDLKKFGYAWRHSDAKHKYAVMWLLLTGSRLGPLENWDPSWRQGQFLVFPRGTEGVKKARHVVMSKAAAACLDRCELPISGNALGHCLDAIARAAGIRLSPVKSDDGNTKKDLSRTGVSPHVLRKTMSTHAAGWEVPELIIDMLQNHKGSAIKQAYIMAQLKSLLPHAEVISSKLLKAMGIKAIE